MSHAWIIAAVVVGVVVVAAVPMLLAYNLIGRDDDTYDLFP